MPKITISKKGVSSGKKLQVKKEKVKKMRKKYRVTSKAYT